MEKWVNVYEEGNYESNQHIWLEDLLKEDNIPYRTAIEEYWVGIKIPKYKQKLKIFIPENYKNKVNEYITEFQKPQSIDSEDIEELENINDTENDIEIQKNNKVRKIFLGFCISIFLMVVIVVVIASIIN